MNWYYKLANNYTIMYHSTNPEYVDNILKNGLLINSEYNNTEEGKWARDIYGINPVFLSLDVGKFPGVPLEVDISGLPLVSDLPSLINKGAYIIEEGFYWDEKNEPTQLKPYLDEGEIDFYELLNNKQIIDIAINITRTAACLSNINPERIRVKK